MCLISVIIPFYNSASYIQKCVESALSQTIDDLEVICVDDCSSDNSAEIVSSISDPRLRVIVLPQNRGVSAARNAGIRAAKGEYIYFLDSDDWLDPDYLEAMGYHSMSENVDSVMNTSVEPGTGGISCSKPTLCPSRIVASYAIATVWSRLYRRKVLIGNCLSFPEGVKESEDYYFTKLAEALSEHILVFTGPVYHHTLRASSLSNQNTFDNIRASKLLYDEMRKRGLSTRGFKLFYAGNMLLDSEERFNFARSFFMEIEPQVKENPEFYVPFDLLCLDAVLSCDTYDAFLEAYNPNLSVYFVKDKLGRK